MRIKIIRLIIIGLFILIALGLIYVQAIRGRYYYNLSTNNRIRVVPSEGLRGRIKDRNGKVLADNRISYNVTVTPQAIKDANELFTFLSEVLGVDQQKLLQRYYQRKFAPFAPVVVAENINKTKIFILEENKYRFPSLLIEEGFQRFYPMGKASAHVLGYIGKMNRAEIEKYKEYGYSPQSVVGRSGVEEYYDQYLKGEKGGYQIEVNSRGQQVRLLSLKEPKRGRDIALTIDGDLQEFMTGLLKGSRGAIIVMDRDSGEVLGLTSSPSYDLNVLVDRKLQGRLSAIRSNPHSPLLNRAIKGLFPPGSIFKIVVALGALDINKITEHTTFTCNGYHEVGGMKFRCAHVHGSQNLIEAIAHSCNVYFYRLGLKIGADVIHRYARMLGLGDITQIDLPYEEEGNIPSRRQGILSRRRPWYTGDTLNFSIGQGDVLTTPVQLVKMMSIIANSGVDVQPHLIKAIGGTTVVDHFSKRKIKIDQNIFKTLQQGMRATVTDYSGTAHDLDLQGLYVAGKTGTAQTSGGRDDHSWFVGYADGTKKNVVFCIFLEHGGSSRNAVLVSRQLLLWMQGKDMI